MIDVPDVTARPDDMPAISWRTCRYVAVDVEGTVSPAGRPEGVVEVAAVEFTLEHAIMRSIHSLLDPGMPITAIGTRIHGLRDGDVAGKPTFSSLCPQMSELIDDAVVVAHNARVDWGLMHRDCPELRPAAALDTLRLSRTLWPEVRQHGLDAVIERLGVRFDPPVGSNRSGRHTALFDATATVWVFLAMVDSAKQRGAGLTGLLDDCVLTSSRSVAASESQMDLFKGGGA